MGIKIGWMAKMRRSKIYTQLKYGMDKAQKRDYLGAISCLTLALDNIEKEENSIKFETPEQWNVVKELYTYCNERRAVAFTTLVIILLDMGDKEKAIDFFNKLKKVDSKGAEELNASLKTQGVQL